MLLPSETFLYLKFGDICSNGSHSEGFYRNLNVSKLSLSSLIVLLETYLNLKFYDYCSDGARSAAFFRNSRWRRRPCWFSQKLQFSEFALIVLLETYLNLKFDENYSNVSQTQFRCSLTSCLQDERSYTSCPGRFPDSVKLHVVMTIAHSM